jgi:hypothetical protein
MTIQFNNETFRDDYSFSNSDWAIKRFPFPFHEDSYMYSVNMEQHRGGPAGSVYEKRFDVDEHYVAEMRDRALVLADDPLRCQSLPHMTLAGWDLLELIMVSKSEDYPDLFELTTPSPFWMKPRFPMGRWNISHDRRRAIFAFLINVMICCGWTQVWSRRKRTGPWISISV